MTPFTRYVKILTEINPITQRLERGVDPSGKRRFRPWTETEIARIHKVYKNHIGDCDRLERLFPGRSYDAIKLKANKLFRGHQSEAGLHKKP